MISLIVSAVAPLGDIAHNRRIAVLRIYNLALVNLLFIGYKIIKLNSSNIILSGFESPALPSALIEFHLSEKVLQSLSLMVQIRLVFSFLLMRLLMTPPQWSEIDAALQLIMSSKNQRQDLLCPTSSRGYFPPDVGRAEL